MDDSKTSEIARFLWEPARVLHERSITREGNMTSVCVFQPAIEVLHRPIRAELFPRQLWSGEGCSGSMEIIVMGEEKVRDVEGRAWTAWKLVRRTVTSSQREEATVWISPELGLDVRAERRIEGSSGHYEQVSVLVAIVPASEG